MVGCDVSSLFVFGCCLLWLLAIVCCGLLVWLVSLLDVVVRCLVDSRLLLFVVHCWCCCCLSVCCCRCMVVAVVIRVAFVRILVLVVTLCGCLYLVLFAAAL